MDLYLVRHAIAFDRDPVTWHQDAERPLTPQGIDRFRQAARGLHYARPDRRRRAQQPLTAARGTQRCC